MIKNNKGITMITLVVMVIVISILASVSTYSAVALIKSSRYYNAVSQMKVVQAEVNEWYEMEKNSESSSWNNGVNVSTLSEEKRGQVIVAYNTVQKVNSEIGDLTEFKYFSKQSLNQTSDIDGIDYDFIINIKTRAVILINGIEKDDITYYSLDQIDGEQYNV